VPLAQWRTYKRAAATGHARQRRVAPREGGGAAGGGVYAKKTRGSLSARGAACGDNAQRARHPQPLYL